MLVIQLLVAAIPVFIVGYIAYEAGLRDGRKETENDRVRESKEEVLV